MDEYTTADAVKDKRLVQDYLDERLPENQDVWEAWMRFSGYYQADDPWNGWRVRSQEEQRLRAELQGRVRHLEAVLRKLSKSASRAALGDE